MTLEAIATLSTVLGSLGVMVTWLWNTAGRVSKAHIELGICKADVVSLKAESQLLRDQSVRQSVLVETVTKQLAKLDQVDQLVAAVDVMRAILERLERRVDRRSEDANRA